MASPFKNGSLGTSVKGVSILALLVLSLSLWSCGGGGGSSGSGGISVGADQYRSPSATIYSEVPAMDIQGGDLVNSTLLYFNPKGPKTSELIDTDEDGEGDTALNEYINFVNAANNMYNGDIAACYGNHSGELIWNRSYQPDTMPSTAVNGTQFIQIVFPFDLDPTSIYDTNLLGVDYLKGITIIDEDNVHVNATTLLNGKDAFGVSYTDLPTHITVAKNVLVFIAQVQPDQAIGSMPAQTTAFTGTFGARNQWQASKNEIRIRINQVSDSLGNLVNVNARYYVAKSNFDKTEVRPDLAPTDVAAWDVLGIDTDIDPNTGLPYAAPHNLKVSRDSSFLLTFNKPVIPETVGRSLVFDRPPFNGNTRVVTNGLTNTLPLPTPCAPPPYNPPPTKPLGTNVTVIAYYIDQNGTSATQAVIPFRCYPLHQNNLAAYVIDPLIDLPGSTPAALAADNPIKIRVDVSVYPAGTNAASADPDDATATLSPVNLAPCGFFDETFTGGGAAITRSFTVEEGGRYVNAPVCPNALYYAMGPSGIGAVDLDGNGFTTNHPDFYKPALVTSLRFYNKSGNSGMGTGNNYAYGAKANPGGKIGLGDSTPVPGINEGSGDKDAADPLNGMDAIVRDSQGRAQLYPDPNGLEVNFNITDLAIGDFLDTMFYDTSNRWARETFHTSFVNSLVGKYKNNTIDTPPTPNPPPLTLPIGMRAVDIIIDDTGKLEEGAFVIMGKEVFSVAVHNFWAAPWPYDTSFVHLSPGVDEPDAPFPPNPFPLFGQFLDYSNSGPLAESSTMGTGFWYGCRQQIGNFLFAVDKSLNEVKVVNSNTMDLITRITGFSDPDSAEVSTDLTKLYVTNSGSGYLSIFNVDPRSSDFLDHIADVQVGSNPKGLCVQPDGEDVLVCNFGSNTISILDQTSNSIRKTVSALLNKPWDLAAGPRQGSFAFRTGVYHAYVSNFGGNNVVMYESGPAGLGGIGYDDILDPVPSVGVGGQQFMAMERPRGVCWDPHFVAVANNSLNGGAFIAHSANGQPMVSRVQFTKQQAPIGPVFIQTPANWIGGTPGFGTRSFEITAQWGGTDNPLSATTGGAMDVTLLDYNREMWQTSNFTGNPYVTSYGAIDNNPVLGMPPNHKHPIRILSPFGAPGYYPTYFPDRLFVSYEFETQIDVINPLDGTLVKTISGLAAPARVLKTYFKF